VRVSFAVVPVLLFVDVVASRAQDTALDQGIALYWSGQYQETIATLSPHRLGELRRDERVECLKYLAFSHVAVGEEDAARDVFVELLEADPAIQLDLSQLSPKILRQFERARDELVQALFEDGKSSYASKDYEQTLDIMDRALLLDSGFVLAREYRELAAEQLSLLEKVAALEAPVAAPVESPPAAEDDRVYHLTSEIQPPVLVSQVNPTYPAAARRARREGIAVVAAVVGADGSVRAAKIVRSVGPDIDRAALEAIRQWRYRPASHEGRPVAVHTVIQIAFELEQ
jgi:TonB family protein